MTDKLGALPASGSGYSPFGPSRVSPSQAEPSIPNADALVRLMSAWSNLPKHKFHAAYPFFENDRQRVVAEYDLCRDDRANLEATALLFAEYADAIYDAIAMEARQRRDAEERPDPKDGSAGRLRHRPDTPSLQTPQGGDS